MSPPESALRGHFAATLGSTDCKRVGHKRPQFACPIIIRRIDIIGHTGRIVAVRVSAFKHENRMAALAVTPMALTGSKSPFLHSGRVSVSRRTAQSA